MQVENLKISQTPDGIIFQVKVVPAGSKTSVEGIYGDMLKVKLSAAPEKGKANEALLEFLAEMLGVKRKFVKIVSGQTSKVKQIAIKQMSQQEFLDKLKAVL
ncbi:MAG TPA: YggU family protein [Phycisphaerales bacterium]|jgi:hypothetical protein|nr:MAG: YggU family protein [Planctomycetes bacterium GWC2_45_44]HBG77532.1 YggU family protein [Phycisphaerales bacterium]HBR19140.1 YggU family protein [Phycisphaerales bacterium]